MGVLVGIQVRDGDAGRLQFTDLRRSLGFNLPGTDPSGCGALREARQSRAKKPWRSTIKEIWDGFVGQYRPAVDQNYMAADR